MPSPQKTHLVVYKNELNYVPLRKFNSKEMDVFFVLCSELRDKGQKKIRLGYDRLRELSNYKTQAVSRLEKDMESIYDKMIQLVYTSRTAESTEKFVLFTGFKINNVEQWIEISVNPELEYILNDITREFTRFELHEFTQIQSSYAKTMYRLLKQWRLVGHYKVQMENFRELLTIPNSYRMTDIQRQVLTPIQRELSKYFPGLNIQKVKKGKAIDSLIFRFDPEDDIRTDGYATFRSDDGEYYQKHIDDYTPKDIERKLPEKKCNDK